ncbi:MAG: dipeptide/oligopeptide/nickel ABC transporter permease/ATP-binding protein [Treponema sp.]|nr:dipeptide/oligopeptide/nickel ABC transporter permease/ATP-binding protein [Treponema sp.]MCL2272952.1 dipeptide/oligopeptide/nickel ABC transporter permease/ATP-binding protein [Treponema sp.]
MKKFLNYVKTRPVAVVSLFLLAFLYIMMLFAEFFAPYSPNTSFADKSYHPPNIRFYQGGWKAQEWRITNSVTLKYARVRDHYSDIKLFGKGEPYKLWGFIPADRHLFTTGDYPVFLMGSDNLGRDMFSRIVYGSRVSLTIGFVATAISLALAGLAGGLAGYFGGITDWSIMRTAEFLMLIPTLYLILFLRSLLANNMDPGQSYMMITLILSLVGWPGSARTIRGMVHAIKREEFVLNAKLEMIPSITIIFRHIIPQIASILIVSVALSIPGFIMTETVLSYLGLGITDPAVSWGSLIKRDLSTIANLRAFPWLLSPVWFLLGVTLAFNFVGDALRDFYDPYHTIFTRRKKLRITKPQGCQGNAASENSDFLTVKNLEVTFSILRGKDLVKVQAVRGLSFAVKKGETLGIVGESGSGKSVSTLAIPGLLPKNADLSGSIIFEGKELSRLGIEALREYRGKKIGMIFQEPGRSFDPLQNIGSVFLETFRNSELLSEGKTKITKEEAAVHAAALLEETGLDNGAERLVNFPHQFSGGQLQRIGIALALAQGCELLIADEPTTALDLTIQKQIMDLLKTLRRTRNISIIFISHDIDLVAEISDRIMVMYGGLSMESSGAHEILSNAKHPYTRALLAASPRFGSHYSRERLITIPGKVSDPSNPESGCPFAPRCSQAKKECTQGIPELLKKDGHEIRCCAANLT